MTPEEKKIHRLEIATAISLGISVALLIRYIIDLL
jgi:hypothetical protein